MSHLSKTDDVEEEDDYLTMTFAEPENDPKKETFTQRKKRLAREAEERSRPKSKAQLAQEEHAKRETALNTANIDERSKGFKMMAALGYKTGTALGKATKSSSTDLDKRLLEPIAIDVKEDRSGIGVDSEKKRKFRQEIENRQEYEKRQKVDALEFRERQQKEREEKRREGQVHGAMKVAERLDEEEMNSHGDAIRETNRPLQSYSVLWRGLIKRRMIADRDRRMRHDLDHSLSRLPTYDDQDEEQEDQIAISRKAYIEEVDLELDQDDEELDAFERLSAMEKLEQLTCHLRDKWHYCFWCKFQYPDADMDGCPGKTEEDHD